MMQSQLTHTFTATFRWSFVLLMSTFSLVSWAEELIVNYNDGSAVIERCRFTLDNAAPVVIDSTTGNIIAQVTDPDACGSTTPVPPTVTVTPATATINLGSSQTISWTSTNAVSCSKSGDWGTGTAALSGSQTVTPTAAGTYTYTISCTNNDGSASDSSVVTVTDPSVPAFCNSIPTFGLTRDTSYTAYAQLTNEAWPGTINEKSFWSIPSNQYTALSFVAGTGSGAHFFEAGSPAQGPSAGYVVKISQCPGDFTRDTTDPDVAFCQRSGASPTLRWSETSQAGFCKLTPGVTYYLNIAHGSVSSDNTTYTNACSSAFCSALFQRSQ